MLGVGASIIGGHSASKAMKRARQGLDQQRTKNENWYNRRYNEDETQRADAQAILAQTQERLKTANRQAAGVGAVSGMTDEALAATKAANAGIMADAASTIAANAVARKDTIEQQYQQNDMNIQNAISNTYVNKANAIAQATQGVGQVAGGMTDAF